MRNWLRDTLARIEQKVDKIMSQQDDINADVAGIQTAIAGLTAADAQLATDVTAIQAALAALPPEVDTSALDAAVASLGSTSTAFTTAVGSVTALVPGGTAATTPVTPAS
jgi:uncharacterized protein YoxC